MIVWVTFASYARVRSPEGVHRPYLHGEDAKTATTARHGSRRSVDKDLCEVPVIEVFGAIRAAVAQTSDAAVTAVSVMKQRAVLAGRTGAVIADPGCTSCACCCALSHGSTRICRISRISRLC